MSNNPDIYIDWLEKSISDEYLTHYKYSDFNNLTEIGNGSFGSVIRASWKIPDRYFVLKPFNNDTITLKEVVNEIKLHKRVDVHQNIIRFFGITREIAANSIRQMNKYSLVLEYADGGTLNAYLDKHFNDLDWNDKYQLAIQLASAVEFIHECDIIHCDLHADNILVHQKMIKLADFGLSKKFAEESEISSKVFVLEFLMWQISSGYQPFKGVDYDEYLFLSILNGKREKIIDATPPEYSNLYQECWNYENYERPNMQKVISTLKAIISLEDDELINANFIEEIELPIKGKSSIRSSKEIDEDLEDLELFEDFNFYNNINGSSSSLQSNSSFQSNMMNFKNNSLTNMITNDKSNLKSKKEGKKNLEDIEKIEDLINESSFSLQSNITIQSSKNNLNSMFQVDNSSKGSVDSIFINHIIVDRLIKFVMKIQMKNIQYIWFLGLFYYYNIGVNENSVKAYELFLKAAEEGYAISQVYLAKCYYNGYGIKCDKKLSFKWYQKSVENGSIIGKFYLGHCYEYGIGTQQNEKKAVYWYYKSAINGNIIAKLHLAECLKLGKGIEKNEKQAFKYYKILAEKEISDAQYQLGNCFYNGIGTSIDKNKAVYWYKNAAKN
ncbi:1909_t:CDS:2, partial [Funneliformis geosporum]